MVRPEVASHPRGARMDALAGISRVMLTDIGIGVLVGMNVNVFADVMATPELVE